MSAAKRTSPARHRVCPDCGKVVGIYSTGRLRQHDGVAGITCDAFEREHFAWLRGDESAWRRFAERTA